MQRAGPGERSLDVTHHERFLDLAVGAFVLDALPRACRHEAAVVPQREALVGLYLNAYTTGNGVRRPAGVGDLMLELAGCAHDEQRTRRDAGLGAFEMTVGDRNRVVPVDEKERFLDANTVGVVAPHRPRVERKRLELAERHRGVIA